MLLRRKRKLSLKVRELQEEDQVATKRHASKRHSESLQERQESQRDAQAHASKRRSRNDRRGFNTKLQCCKAMKNNVAILLKRLRSRDMA